MCERTSGAPRRRPTAIRTVALSIFRPTGDSGSVLSQSREPRERAERTRARPTAASSKKSACTLHARCDEDIGGTGITEGMAGLVGCFDQADKAASIPLSLVSRNRAGRSVDVHSAVLAAEAK